MAKITFEFTTHVNNPEWISSEETPQVPVLLTVPAEGVNVHIHAGNGQLDAEDVSNAAGKVKFDVPSDFYSMLHHAAVWSDTFQGGADMPMQLRAGDVIEMDV